MKDQRVLYSIVLFLFILLNVQLDAQTKPPYTKKKKVPLSERNLDIQKDTISSSNQQDTSKVKIKSADEVEGIYTETESIQFLKGNVILFQNDAYFYCDSAYLYENQNAAHAWGNVTIVQSDTIELFSDTLKYFGETEDAYMIGNVILKDSTQEIYTERLDYNMKSKIATYKTGGLLRQGDSQLTSTYGKYNAIDDQAFFRDSVVVINDKFTLKADSLLYDTENRKSTFLGPTLILQDSAKIYCESGYYNYQENKAEFNTNPQYIKGDKVAVSDRMSYDGETKKVTLVGNAKFREKDKLATADKMIYDETEDITRLEGNAYFKDEEQEVNSDVIIYDGKDGSYNTEGKTIAKTKDSLIKADNSFYNKETNITSLTGNVYVADSTQILTAEQVDFNNDTEDAHAKGNVHWQDTINDVSIKSTELIYNKETDYVKALGRPLMTTIMDGDTLYLSADTLISETIVLDSLDTIKQLVAYRDVRMFKEDFQGVCDSLNYNMTDSIFYFYDTPLLWSDSSQFSADTVKILLKDEAIDSVYLMNKALIVDTPDEAFFNQIKGRDIHIRFNDSKPYRMSVFGNGESVYYIQDDDRGYVGPNKTTCGDMFLYFEEGELEFIRFIGDPEGKLHPMKTANHNEMKLPGFKWEKQKRPNSPADLDSPFFVVEGKDKLEEKLETVEKIQEKKTETVMDEEKPKENQNPYVNKGKKETTDDKKTKKDKKKFGRKLNIDD